MTIKHDQINLAHLFIHYKNPIGKDLLIGGDRFQWVVLETGMCVGAFCYADDVTLLATTGMALNAMLDTCTRFADAHNLLFNSSKAKCLFLELLTST